jgi:Inner membrane protein YgaP-like, transmembrane domain
MAKNVGGIDRVIRAVVGIGLMALAMTGGNSDFVMNYMVEIGAVGFIVLLTAILGWCPAYLPFGIKTCKPK